MLAVRHEARSRLRLRRAGLHAAVARNQPETPVSCEQDWRDFRMELWNKYLVLNLTRHEQKVLWVVLALVVIGLAARLYRESLPPPSGQAGPPSLYATS
jgi:hypothetical protein